MQILTHQTIKTSLCGHPDHIENGYSRVVLTTTTDMAVDAKRLVHGGFVFGLADHAAMIAVNHPNVVLGAADVRFLKPVMVGETIIAHARVETVEGKKQHVGVHVEGVGGIVFQGRFMCFVLDRHVLDQP